MKKGLVPVIFGLLLAGPVPALFAGGKSLRIAAMIFETKPESHSVVGGRSDGKGGIVGTQVGGMVTSAFPNGTVHMKLGGSAGFDEAAIRSLIKKSFVFECGPISEGLHAFLLGRIQYSFAGGASTVPSPPRVPLSWLEAKGFAPLELDIEVLSERAGNVILELRFGPADTLDAGPRTGNEDPAALIPTKKPILTDYVFGLRKGEPLLIGTSYFFEGKSVFWIALSAEDVESPPTDRS